MFTIILLLAIGDTPAVTPSETAAVEAREAANMAKFKAEQERNAARASLLASGRAQIAIDRAAKEQRTAERAKLYASFQGYSAGKKAYVPVKERAAKLYANRTAKSKPKSVLPDGPVENPFIKK